MNLLATVAFISTGPLRRRSFLPRCSSASIALLLFGLGFSQSGLKVIDKVLCSASTDHFPLCMRSYSVLCMLGCCTLDLKNPTPWHQWLSWHLCVPDHTHAPPLCSTSAALLLNLGFQDGCCNTCFDCLGLRKDSSTVKVCIVEVRGRRRSREVAALGLGF